MNIDGKNILLTPLLDADSPHLFKWINNKELVEKSAPFKVISQQEHSHWFERIQSQPSTVIFAIRKKHTLELIGYCQLLNIHPIHQSAELQIRIGEATQTNKGYGTEAVSLLLTFGFATLKLNRIFLHVFESNKIAQRAYQKVGFQKEGCLRQGVYIGGKYQDIEVYGILAQEFNAKYSNQEKDLDNVMCHSPT